MRRETWQRSALGLAAGRPPSLAAALVVGTGAAALVGLLWLWVEYGGPFPGDAWVQERSASAFAPPEVVTDLTALFSILAAPAVAGVTVLVGAAYAMRAEGGRGALFVLLAAAGVVVNAGLKVLFGPTRPFTEIATDPSSLNYPSGHVVYAVVVFGALAVLARRAGRSEIALPLVVLILGMGPARVVATAHLVSDVVAGYLVGLAWLVLAAALALPTRSRRR